MDYQAAGCAVLWVCRSWPYWAPLLLLLAGLRREPLSQALPDAAVSYMLLPYVGFTLGLLPLLQAAHNGALFVLYLMLLGVVRRYCGVLRGTGDWQTQAGAASESRQIVGRRGRVGDGRGGRGLVVVSLHRCRLQRPCEAFTC